MFFKNTFQYFRNKTAKKTSDEIFLLLKHCVMRENCGKDFFPLPYFVALFLLM